MAIVRKYAALLIGGLIAIGCEKKPTTGDLVVTISGLPTGAAASARVTGPNSFSQQITGTTTLENLAPGEYTVSVGTVHFSNALFASTISRELHTVTAGHSEAVAIPYALASGSINFIVTGLPAGVAPSLVLSCSTCAIGGFTKVISTTGVVGELVPGNYVLRTDTLQTTAGDLYGSANVQQSIALTPSLTPVDANVSYSIASGSLAVDVTGMPAGVTPDPITVTGPNSFRRTLAASSTLRGLVAGTYSIAAVTANGACPNIYTPQQTSQSVQVSVGNTATASVAFDASQIPPSSLNLKIDGMHLVQVVQDYNGATPMVAGKQAYLRIFGLANQCNTATPKIRVTLGGIPNARSFDINANESSVRTVADQGVLAASYNIMLPAADIQPGLTVAAEIDPDNVVPEANESDNKLPATGARTVDVRVVPSVSVRFIPITSNNLTGNATAARIDEFLAMSRAIHPAFSYDGEIGEGYSTTTVMASTSQSWGQLLSELDTKRVADSSASGVRRYYVGVVKVNYNSGVAGIGFRPGKSTLTWDYFNSAGPIIAHELGHNYDRSHSPCGGPSGIDQNWPNTGLYVGGFIGQYGIDLSNMLLKQPQFYTDIMGYCNNQWISDYTYFYMMQYLINHPVSQPAISTAPMQPSLLVWGRIVDGQPVLEPAFQINARPELPPTGTAGAHRLTAVDDAGAEIFSMSFTADRIADIPGDQRSFAFAVPMSMLQGRKVAALRLTANGRTVSSVAAGDVAADSRTLMTRTGPRALRVQWDAARFPTVMVRDPATGNVLSFARGGDVTIATPTDRVELVYSNRVSSTRVVKQLR